MDPLTPLDTLCRIILRGREYEAQTASDYDPGESAENIDEDDEGFEDVIRAVEVRLRENTRKTKSA